MSLTLLPKVLQKYKRTFFFETGTHEGGAILLALQTGFERVFSVEVSRGLYERAALRFKQAIERGDVKLFHGDSAEVLAREVRGLGRPTTFWLDAHDDSGAQKPTPVCAEVEAILRALGGLGEHVILEEKRCQEPIL
jgi:hypothetical protein